MEEMQFSAIVLLTLLLLKLLLLPHKVTLNTVVDRSRWLMIIGITLLDLQFLLQYTLGLRAMGVTQAVLLNLLLFIPCSWIISLAIIYLQRQGELKGGDRLVGGVTWALAILLLGIAAAIDGQPLLSDSPKLHYAEITVSFLYLAMQGHYSWRLLTNLKAMQLDLQNYYDHDMDHILLWMKYSTIILGFLAVMVPMLIFIQSQVLAIFTIFFFISIFYLVDTFCNYMLSSAPKKMAKAEIMERLPSTSEQEHATTVPEASFSGSAEAKTLNASLIKKWIENGGFRHCGLTMPAASEKIGIPRYLLSAWLKQQDLTYAAWITALRIDEAKRIIKEQPQWTNEAISQYCGFSDRSYFQKKFKDSTGMTPAEYGETIKQ